MSSFSPSSRLLRRARGLLSLSLLGLAAVPLIGWSNVVEVTVDGESLSTRTYASTVGDVLAQLDVPVGPSDEVTPAPQVPIDEVDAIAVDRAVRLDVAIDGTVVRRISAHVSSVAGALREAGLDARAHGAEVAPDWTAPVADGDTIHVNMPTPVRVTVDGEAVELATLADTVGEALDEAGIEVGADDVVDWNLDTAVQPHTNVLVERVSFDEVVERVAIEHDVVRRETDELRKGVTRVEVEGRNGVREVTYRVETLDGEEVDRERLSSEVVREPRDRVVLVGTFVPPPPPPPAPPPTAAPKPAPAAPKPSAPRTSTSDDSVWDRLAQCESGGNWGHRGGTYHGGLQFHPQTWNAYKPAGAPQYAYEASREVQIQAGKAVQRSQGWEAWPHCSKQIGVR
jgi:resuscitation-promoting factor RpfB